MNILTAHNRVECIILGAGSGTRIGKGPKAFVRLGQTTLLQIAVNVAFQVFNRVIVALPADHINSARSLITDPRVVFVSGGPRRIDTLRILVQESKSNWIVLHDVVHPFISPKVIKDVLEAAYLTGAAAATERQYDFLYSERGEKLADPGKAFIVQKPIAFCRDRILKGFKKADLLGITHDASILEIFNLAEIIPTFIKGSPLNRKITHSSDLKLAEAIVSRFDDLYQLIDGAEVE